MTIISVSHIHAHTQTPTIDYEIGGTFRVLSNGALIFNHKVRSMGVPLPGDDRISIPLTGEKNQMVWHTHPYHAGWWPSYEDITRDDKIHILFTRYGAWVFKNGKGIVVRFDDWNAFHHYMLRLGNSFDVHAVYAEIQRFSAHVPLDITFVPYFFPRDAPRDNAILRQLVSI
jgi:hypothetical protein